MVNNTIDGQRDQVLQRNYANFVSHNNERAWWKSICLTYVTFVF